MLKRLYIIIFVLLTAGSVAAAAVSFKALSDYGHITTEKRLADSARLVSLKLADDMSFGELDSYVAETFFSENESIRITLISTSGKVVFDSETDSETMDDHLNRPEIAQALSSGKSGTSIRRSATLEIDTFYFAVYDKASGYVIRAAMPMQIYESSVEALRNVMIILFLVFALFFIVTGIVAARITTAPLLKLKSAADRMASGDHCVHVPVRGSDSSEIAQLSRSFNYMAKSLEEAQNELINDNIRMDMVLNAIGNPIIAVDEDLMVSYINSEARRDFMQNSFPDNEHYPMLSVIRSVETEALVKKAILSGSASDDKISITTRSGRKIFRVNVFITNNNKGKAAIVLFQDVSQIERLAQMRTDFVSSVTHELKTPLTSIRGFVETLRSNKVDRKSVV